jgi:RimJ/RimL family protein N-acetyltransferase
MRSPVQLETVRALPGNGTKRLVIRLLERRDLEEARVLHNDDETLTRLTDISHVSERQQEAWFDAMSTSRTSRRYVARLRSNDAFVGVFRVDRFDPWNRNALVGADVVPALRHQGYATEMFDYVLRYLFDQCGLHRVALSTLDDNAPALALYRKLGFVEEGRERQAIFREGAFRDLVVMGLLAAEWRQRSGR